MPPSRRRNAQQRLTTQATELALAAPQVVTQRLLRMAAAGGAPSARDRREFQRMGLEKVAAFHESWAAMFAEAVRVNQQIALAMVQTLWFPWLGPRRGAAPAWPQAVWGVLGRGLAPVHGRAVANARRLGRPSARR